ncbi:hypothetical protein AYO44_10390 [Planctomycetaceae bacterium SCGC AG-212-F19]|nr:hypothetical protein AYO44_10390 [Planctomycetaceae bacterium SCGC AG-212-F19]
MDTFEKYFPEDGDGTAGFHRELRSRLPDQGAVLDLGCGDHTQLARYRTSVRQVWGSDFQQHPRLAHPEWFRPLHADGVIPFVSESFDVVSCLWVLEHVAQPVAFLREVARVLHPGGRLVVFTVDGRHYVSWVTRLLRCLPHAITQEIIYRLYGRLHQDTHPTYFRLNTPAQIERAARSAGLRIAGIRRFANPEYFSFWPPLRRAAIVADWLLEKFLPGFGRIYLVATLEKPMRRSTIAAKQAA